MSRWSDRPDGGTLIVSVHVPKTAGTSFHIALERHFGSRMLRDYDGQPLLRITENEARRAPSSVPSPGEAAALARSYDVVHGHFPASKYLALGAAARFAVFLRDPVERTISHYRHWRRAPDARNPLARAITAGNLDLVTFSRQPEIRDLYACLLDGVPLQAFAFIGLTESYDRSLALFEAMFGAKLEALRENKAAKTDREAAVTRRERARISTTQAANAVIYQRAERRFEALCERYL